MRVGGGALSGPSRGQSALGKANRMLFGGECLKGRRGRQVPSLKAPGANARTRRAAVLNTPLPRERRSEL